MIADLSQATAATINSLRRAFQVQKVLERDARGGTRYVEFLKAHFSVTSPDFRLQRPEYLGGSSKRININPVEQTSRSDANENPQGNLAAYATVHEGNSGFTKSFVEHGHIIGICNVRADLSYQQGINKLWSRSTRYDFYLPAFAHLGEQEVLNQEIYADGSANDTLVFGYQERWAEMRYKPSNITNIMRSNAAGTLEAWHLAQDFGTLPALNATFIQSTTDMARVEATPNQPDFIMDAYIELKSARPMPVYSVPGQIDRF